MLNLDIVEISDEQAQGAKLLASGLSEPSVRKRGMIDMLGISCAVNYLHAKRFRVDTRRSVYKVPLLFEEFKLTDIYYGNYRIDVITLYKEKNVKIPRIHVDMDILPHFYFVVQIGAKIKEAKMIGFIEAKNILSCSHDSKFYYPPLDLIFDCKKFAALTARSIATKTLLGKHVDCMGLFLKFMDNELPSVYKRQMIQHLMNCDSCRARFIDTIEFEKLAKNLKYYPELLQRSRAVTQTRNIAIDYENQTKFPNLEEVIENSAIEEQNKAMVALQEREDFDETDDINDNFKDIKSDTKSDSDEFKTVQMFDLSDKSGNKQLSTKVIDSIFSGIPKLELPPIKTMTDAKNRRKILIAVLIFIVLSSFALISVKGTSDIEEENKLIENFEDPFEDSNNEYSYEESQERLLPKNKAVEDYTVQRPKVAEPAYSPSISKISWEAPESIAKKDSYKKFLMLAGKNIKLNLQNDLLLVNDIPVNKNVKLEIKIASSGDVEIVRIISSSGSDLIDASAKKVVSETLNYMKPPSHGIVSHPVSVTLSAELQ